MFRTKSLGPSMILSFCHISQSIHLQVLLVVSSKWSECMQKMNISQNLPLWSKSPSSITGIVEIASKLDPLVLHSPFSIPTASDCLNSKQSDSVIGDSHPSVYRWNLPMPSHVSLSGNQRLHYELWHSNFNSKSPSPFISKNPFPILFLFLPIQEH